MKRIGATIIETISSLFVNLTAYCKKGSQDFKGVVLLLFMHNCWLKSIFLCLKNSVFSAPLNRFVCVYIIESVSTCHKYNLTC